MEKENKILARIYQLLLYPFSYLPFWVLYLKSNFLYFVLYHFIKYRKEVIIKNLSLSFPEKSPEEIRQLAKVFYRHLADIFLEGVKAFGISKKALLKRYQFENPELLNDFYDKGKSVLLMSAHYNNWEYMILCLSMQVKHHGIGVGKAMSNKTMHYVAHKSRTRYGTEVVYSDKIRESFDQNEKDKKLVAYMMLSDQSPGDPKKAHWTTFLHQDTGFIFGSEYFSRKYELPVLYYHVKKTKRGYYSVRFELICEHPDQYPNKGEIIDQYVSRLERDILATPWVWLWSHKRWKLSRPENLVSRAENLVPREEKLSSHTENTKA